MRLNEKLTALISTLDKSKLIEIILTICEEETKERLIEVFEKYPMG